MQLYQNASRFKMAFALTKASIGHDRNYWRKCSRVNSAKFGGRVDESLELVRMCSNKSFFFSDMAFEKVTCCRNVKISSFYSISGMIFEYILTG